MVQISEVKGTLIHYLSPGAFKFNVIGTARENRVAAHSHIKSLGLREDGMAEQTAAGFIGQQQAREVTPLL
jgi:DNA helicase TIP49 (TBP-interacting protein)